MNELAMFEGEPGWVTMVSRSDVAEGWRDHRSDGGLVMDVRTNDVVCEGLSMPHSPRWYRKKLWLLNPGNGELGHVDLKRGERLEGLSAGDRTGGAVAGGGDLDGDGLADAVIGAWGADRNAEGAGSTYVLFGAAARDVAVTKSNGAGHIDNEQPVTYEITVTSETDLASTGVRLVDTLPPNLDAGAATWTCSATGGASCPSASGSGDIDETFDLPGKASLIFTLTAPVLASEGENVVNSATVSLPAGSPDRNPANNTATDIDPVGLFIDGFEDP